MRPFPQVRRDDEAQLVPALQCLRRAPSRWTEFGPRFRRAADEATLPVNGIIGSETKRSVMH